MSTSCKVRAIAAKFCATIWQHNSRTFGLTVDAPAGNIWRSSRTHALVIQQWDGERRDVAWRDLQEQMESGVEECTDPDCNVCDEARS